MRRLLLGLVGGALLSTGLVGCSIERDRPVAGEGDPTFADPIDVVLHLRGEGCAPNIAGLGTVVALADGFAVTVAHAFEGVASFEVVDASGDALDAELLVLDTEKDLAVLRVDHELGGTTLPDVGSRLTGEATVVTYGRFNDGPEVRTAEVLRRVTLTLDGDGRRVGYELGIGVEPGDSGGAVLDADGDLAAVVFASARGEERSWSTASVELRPLLARAAGAAPIELVCPR